jgi:hypothetical protein
LVAWWSYIVLVSFIMDDFYCSMYFEWQFFWVEYPRIEVIFIQCPKFLISCPSYF